MGGPGGGGMGGPQFPAADRALGVRVLGGRVLGVRVRWGMGRRNRDNEDKAREIGHAPGCSLVLRHAGGTTRIMRRR